MIKMQMIFFVYDQTYMYDLASFKYIFVECFIYVLVLLLLEFASLTLSL